MAPTCRRARLAPPALLAGAAAWLAAGCCCRRAAVPRLSRLSPHLRAASWCLSLGPAAGAHASLPRTRHCHVAVSNTQRLTCSPHALLPGSGTLPSMVRPAALLVQAACLAVAGGAAACSWRWLLPPLLGSAGCVAAGGAAAAAAAPALLRAGVVAMGMAVLPLKRDCARAPPTSRRPAPSCCGAGAPAGSPGCGSAGWAAAASCRPPPLANHELELHLEGACRVAWLEQRRWQGACRPRAAAAVAQPAWRRCASWALHRDLHGACSLVRQRLAHQDSWRAVQVSVICACCLYPVAHPVKALCLYLQVEWNGLERRCLPVVPPFASEGVREVDGRLLTILTVLVC